MPSNISATEHRRTGLIARVIDENLNSWEDFAGQDINIPIAYGYVEGTGPGESEQDHWVFRGQAAMCLRATDGAIVRVRVGDGTPSDRTVYRQVITNPLDSDQWETWTQLYTGNHYAIAIVSDPSAGAGYRIFTSKSDGIYKDNVKLPGLTLDGIVKIKPFGFESTKIAFQRVYQDGDGFRALQWAYILDTNAGSVVVINDPVNYPFYRHDLNVFRGNEVPVGSGNWQYYRLRSNAFDGAARDQSASEVITMDFIGDITSFGIWDQVQTIKGPSGQAGFRTITNLFTTNIVNSEGGYYYHFWNEQHFDVDGNFLSNLKNPLFWARAQGRPAPMTQAIPVGFSIWGFAGVVQWGDYVWIGGNSRVLRRPVQATVIDISNYVIEGDYAVPRENGQGAGKLECANPKNVLGTMLGIDEDTVSGLTERRLLLALGKQGVNDHAMSWKRDSTWWLSQLVKHKDGAKQQLTVEFGDIWYRLQNPFRETIMIPGQFNWGDWNPSGTNQLYNWFNNTDEFFRYNPAGAATWSVPRIKCSAVEGGTNSITLFAGWRGENAFFQALVWDGDGIVFRYVDENNYYLLDLAGNQITLRVKKDGTFSTLGIAPGAVTPACWIGVNFSWSNITVYVNFNYWFDFYLFDPEMFVGFVGYKGPCEISNFFIKEFNSATTTATLIDTLLAQVDEHAVTIDVAEDASAQQLNVLWGPQSDLSTPEQAMRQLLEASKLEAIWLEDE